MKKIYVVIDRESGSQPDADSAVAAYEDEADASRDYPGSVDPEGPEEDERYVATEVEVVPRGGSGRTAPSIGKVFEAPGVHPTITLTFTADEAEAVSAALNYSLEKDPFIQPGGEEDPEPYDSAVGKVEAALRQAGLSRV